MATQIILEIQVNDNENLIERRFPSEMPISELKNRLELICGASASTMKLEFRDTTGTLIGSGNDSDSLNNLITNPVGDNRLRLHVRDSNAVKLEDLSSVPKYEMSEEEYSKRSESLRQFKLKNKLGRFSGGDASESSADEEYLKNIKIGERCEVTVKNMEPRRGKVMYIGKLGSMPGTFVGVRYDEPCGKNDGSFENVRYFECPPNYGGFVKAQCVKCGDYPELEINFDE